MSGIQAFNSHAGFSQGKNYSAMPRPAGDGMDCEALRNHENIITQAPQSARSSKGRHENLSTSSHTTTHVKVASRKFIPHEPVKGAVKPVSDIWTQGKPQETGSGISSVSYPKILAKGNRSVSMNPGGTGKLKSVQELAVKTNNANTNKNSQGADFYLDKYMLESRKALEQSPFSQKQSGSNPSQTNTLTSSVSMDSKSSDGSLAKKVVRTVQVPVYNAPSHLKMSTYETIQRQQRDKVTKIPAAIDCRTASIQPSDTVSLNRMNSNYSNMNKADTVLVEIDDGQHSAGKEPLSEVKLDLVVSALDEMRMTEGQSGQSGDLFSDLEETKKQLEAQIQVNSDLKKLLVASMGDDLHYKVDRLVRDRVQLSEEIGGFTRKMYQDHEDLDKLNIQADMWRSKYMASKVMVDQLTTLRDELSSQVQLSRHGLFQTLQERNQLRDSLLQIHSHLRQLKEAFDPTSLRKHSSNIATVLDLAHTDLELAESVKFRLLGPIHPAPEHCDRVGHDALTIAEQLACRLLSDPLVSEASRAWLASASANLDEYQRFHPQVRYDNLTFNCCRKCKGDIQVI